MYFSLVCPVMANSLVIRFSESSCSREVEKHEAYDQKTRKRAFQLTCPYNAYSEIN
jgi:hypothetical protein